MDAAEILEKSADYIEQHGWVKGRDSDAEGRVCLVAAMGSVVSGKDAFFDSREYEKDSEFRRAAKSLLRVLVEQYGEGPNTVTGVFIPGQIVFYNDNCGAGLRDQQEAVMCLQKAAVNLRGTIVE